MFGSLAKTEQKSFTDLTMAYAGPSEKDTATGCLARLIQRSAKVNDDYEPDDFEEEYNEMQDFWFYRNGSRYRIRARTLVVGGDDQGTVRSNLKIEVCTQSPRGQLTWVNAQSIPFTSALLEHGEPHTKLLAVYYKAAEELLPRLEAMIKCAACGIDVYTRPTLVRPDGTTYPAQHCGCCCQYTWKEPCSNCGSHLGERERVLISGHNYRFTGKCVSC